MNEAPNQVVPQGLRDARPFVAFQLRQNNGEPLHELARWVENLPSRHPQMERIEATESLDYSTGNLRIGECTVAVIDNTNPSDLIERDNWLTRLCDAVESDSNDSDVIEPR